MDNLTDIYNQARKRGLACVSEKEARGENPYLPVLDHFLKDRTILKKEKRGILEIPTNLIVGTCHESRTTSFAANFMPLLQAGSEFAGKWMNLYHHCMNEGLHDAITVYQVFGRYFVEEGNKRVSVMRFLHNPLISAQVTEIVIDPEQVDQRELYENYLRFEEATGVSSIIMSQAKNYPRLLRLLLADDQKTLSPEESHDLASFFSSFKTVLEKVAGKGIKATSGDAFLLFVDVYGYSYGEIVPDSLIEKELTHILPVIKAYPEMPKAALLTKTDVSDHKSLLSAFKEPIKAALIQEGDPATSSWSGTHYQAFRKMFDNLRGQVEIKCFPDCRDEKDIRKAMDESIAWGAQVIFTAHPLMLPITNQYAARYPKVRFLNCSLNPETTVVRSYYTRGYEIQFLQGLAAGALSATNHIGYIADYPIYGAIADINAFAIGVSMVRPNAKVYLEWSTTTTPTNHEFPNDIDMIYISGQDFDPRILKGKRFGLFDVRTSQFSNLSSVSQKWSVFYTQILQSIMNRTYRADETKGSSINYWLGLSNGLIDVSFSEKLPVQTRRMIELIRTSIARNEFFVFDGIHDPNNRSLGTKKVTMDQIATMNWLVDNIVGTIPEDAKLIPSAEKLVQLHGLDPIAEADPDEKDTENTHD